MGLIKETDLFIVEAFNTPHITRTDGGHVKIYPKVKYSDRTELPKEVAIEFIKLTMIVGKSFMIAMKNRGIELVRVNYQEMGNWAFKKGDTPYFHIHIYGRAKDAKFQPYREAVTLPDRTSGFYDEFEPLNEGDIAEIRKQIEIVAQEPKYQESWI